MRRCLILSGVLLMLAGCASDGLRGGNRQWTLVRLELDRAHLANAGTLPLFRQTGGESFGLLPRASGYLRATDAGKVACEVKVREPVVTYAGRGGFNEYVLVSFFGISSEDGSRAMLPDAGTVQPPLGTTSELRVTLQPQGRLQIHTFSGEQPLPYVYYFDPASSGRGLVHVPTVP